MAITRIRNNQVYNSDINAQYKLQPYSVTGGLLANNFTYTGNLTVGNLIVNGLTTTVDTTNLVIADPLFAINRNQSGTPSYDLGFVMGRGNQNNVAFIWEENAQQFQLQYTTESTAATTFGTITNTGFANLQAYGIKVNNSTITTSTVTNNIVANTAISGGTINNTTIGATTPNSGVFTSVTTASGGQLTGYLTGAIGANTPNTAVFTTVTASGNITAQTANVYAAYIVANTASYSAQYYWTNSATLASTITGTYSNSNVASYLPTYNGNVGNITVGNLIPLANTTYYLGNSTNYYANVYANNFNAISQLATPKIQFTVGGAQILEDNSLDLAIVGPYQISIKPASYQYTFNNTGSITGPGGTFVYANGAIYGNITATGAYWSNGVSFASTITGTYSNSNVASYLTTYNGNLSAGNLVVTNGGQVVGYLNGPIGANTPNSGVFTTVTTSGSITSGNQVVGYLNGAIGANSANSAIFTTVTASGNITAQTANVYANYIIANTGYVGLVLTNSQPYITNVGTLTSLNVSGSSTFNTVAASSISAGLIGNSGSELYGANIAITGNALIQNGLALNSNATITTDQTTASVFNTTPTTLNIGGGATTINFAKNDGTSAVKINGTANSYGSGQGALQIAGGFYAGGDSYIAGNLSITGNLTSVGYNELIANAPLLYLSVGSISTYNYELGFYSHKYDAIEGYNHTGLVRNHVDNAWFLFSNIRTEPTNTVDLANASIIYDTLKLGNIIAYSGNTSTSTTTGAAVIYGGMGVGGNIYAAAIQGTPIGNGLASTGAFTTITSSNNITAQTANVYASNVVGNTALYGAQYYWSNGVALASTITGTYSNSNVAAYLPIYSGNLSAGNVSVSGSINATGNINAGTANVYASWIIGNTALNGLVATNAQPYITSVGPSLGTFTVNTPILNINGGVGSQLNINGYTIINVTGVGTTFGLGGAVTSSNLQTVGTLANLTSSGNITAQTANVYANYVISNSGLQGTLITNAQPYITSLGTLTSLNTSGNITSTSANVYAAWIVANTALQGLLATNAQPYITSVGTLTSLTTSGVINTTNNNLTVGTANVYAGNIIANNSVYSSSYYYSNGVPFVTTPGGSNTFIQFSNSGVFGGATYLQYNYVSGNLVSNSTSNSTSTTTGAIVVAGGLGVGGNFYGGANISATNALVAPNMYNSNVYPITGSDLYKNTGPNGNLWINYNGYTANLIVNGNSTSGFGNLFSVNGLTGQVGIKVATSGMVANASLIVNSTDSILIPIGSSSQRPATSTAGMIRYNSQSNQLEFYNGSSWISAGSTFTVVTAQQFTGDGSTTTFTLSQSSTTAATIVSINGVLQIPTTAYTVTGTTLTFTEAPLSTDIIDARVVVTTTIAGSIGDQLGNTVVANSSGITVTTNYKNTLISNVGGNYISGGFSALTPNIALTQNTPTVIDSFSTSVYRVAKYVIKVTDGTNNVYCGAEVIVAHNGSTATSQVYGVVNTGGNALATFSSTVSGGNVNVTANTWSSTASATVFPTYMPI
jgi:hypothetical protein